MCYDRLLKVFQTMPSAQKQLIVAWILHDVSKELFVNRLVEPALVRLFFADAVDVKIGCVCARFAGLHCWNRWHFVLQAFVSLYVTSLIRMPESRQSQILGVSIAMLVHSLLTTL